MKIMVKAIVVLMGCWVLVEVTARLLYWFWERHEIEILMGRR
jgi:hypothetical protein